MSVKRVLMLAPQPFFEERGTPIAVRMLLETVARPGELEFDLVTYAPGIDLTIPAVNHLRIGVIPWPPFSCSNRTIRPGLSISKLLADGVLLWSTFVLLCRKPRGHYTHVHAVEEAVFIALLCKWMWRLPYVYDMDSSLADQVVEKAPILRSFSRLLHWLESCALRNASGTIAVCEALAERARSAGSPWTELLADVSLLGPVNAQLDLRHELGLSASAKLVVYVGNLETYQGLDLLLESWAKVHALYSQWNLVIIGGSDGSVRQQYQNQATRLGASRVYLAGPRPVEELASYLGAADILVSPRISGSNTPMKIYSYLHAGKAILATNLPTHRQVLNDEIALLCAPQDFARELSRLMGADPLRESLARAAARYAVAHCTREIFEERARAIYAKL